MPARSDRREFLKTLALDIAAGGAFLYGEAAAAAEPEAPGARIRLGLVTYNWGREWDVPTIIRNCTATGFAGVELRSTHRHGVEIAIDRSAREAVRKQFEDSAVELVGLGSACEYHSPDPAVVKKNVEETRAFVLLCRDVGGSGVKVRPNGLPEGIPVEKTLEQIGRSLREVARYGADHGVQIRLEVHGRGTSQLPHIARIMEIADHPNAVVCWNCNPTDLAGEGLEHNWRLVRERTGIVHIHDLRNGGYPWKPFFRLLAEDAFDGWTLLEEGDVPDDIVSSMAQNRRLWRQLTDS